MTHGGSVVCADDCLEINTIDVGVSDPVFVKF